MLTHCSLLCSLLWCETVAISHYLTTTKYRLPADHAGTKKPEDLVQEKERETRALNIVIHGLTEPSVPNAVKDDKKMLMISSPLFNRLMQNPSP